MVLKGTQCGTRRTFGGSVRVSTRPAIGGHTWETPPEAARVGFLREWSGHTGKRLSNASTIQGTPNCIGRGIVYFARPRLHEHMTSEEAPTSNKLAGSGIASTRNKFVLLI